MTNHKALAADLRKLTSRTYACGCVLCICEGEERCNGCGAKICGKSDAECSWKQEVIKALKVPEPVAVVSECFDIRWAGSGPIAPLIERNGIKVGTKLYTRTPIPEKLTNEEPFGIFLTDGGSMKAFFLCDDAELATFLKETNPLVKTFLYTAPPVPSKLTEEELDAIYGQPQTHAGQYARAIEAAIHAKLGAKT